MFFDFDGVLVESADIKTDAFRVLYGQFGQDVVARCVAHHSYHAGISRVRKIQHYHSTFLHQSLSPKELDAWVGRYSDLVEAQVVAAPAVLGVEAFLHSASAQLPLFVISGTPQEELKRIVTARGWDGFFSEVHGSPRLKTDIIDDIAGRTNLDLSRVLFVGDAMTDFDAAKERGVAFLGRVAPHHDNPFSPGTEIVEDLTGLFQRVGM
ncbi:HAD family hydrolase [Magnetovibrio blakemorei]|uniref:HAD family hydrolase n=1 Tax=Magnetovibrio blakemorei TaxID=28181 RepID=UPI0024800CE7|nr:HAD hydrolase-like protein [Magnetovibrio blakemorei]